VVTLDDGCRGNALLLDVFRKHSVVPTVFLCSGVVGTHRRFWWTMVPGGYSGAERLMRMPDRERIETLSALGHSETEAFPAPTALSHSQVESMKTSVDLQSHTVLHPILSRCSDERAWAEIAQSRADLESRYGISVYALSYPGGTSADYGDRDVAFAMQAGYECALTAVSGLNGRRTDLFKLRRIVVHDDASCDEVIVRASLLHKYLKMLLPFARSRR
jgi:peptidoglycan/xylan/chitin deacetylase (PgdA/CDA1 family)